MLFRSVVERADYVDVIIVAKLQCQGQSQSFLPVEEWRAVSAFHRLGLSPIPDVLEAEGLGEQMQGNLSVWR